jgi:hyaluronoglucosaminidase
MNCYSSLWDLGENGKWETSRKMNQWYRPFDERQRREWREIVNACKRNRIDFCFSMNPNLFSDRAFDYASDSDFEALWQHYAWMQGLGVKWFNISLDDITQRIDGDGQARLLNRMLQRLRVKDKSAQLIFCPTWYAGPSASMKESSHRLGSGDTPGQRYTRDFASKLDPAIYLFWTGPDVSSVAITRADAEAYRALVHHKIFIWDNYPVNDQTPALHLGPLRDRDPGLAEIVAGYIGNPLSFQNEINRIPMLTMADFLWNPAQYDPQRSIGQAIAHVGKSGEERELLRDLVQLYPGRLWDGSNSTAWNSLRQRHGALMKSGSKEEASALAKNAAAVLDRMARVFPDRYRAEREVLAGDVRAIQAAR